MVRFTRYNVARKLLDHRVPFDYASVSNKNVFTSGYFKGMQQQYFGNIMYSFQFYIALGLSTVLTLVVGAKMYVGYKHGRDSNDPTNRFRRAIAFPEATWIEGQISGENIPYSKTFNQPADDLNRTRDWPIRKQDN